MTFKARPEAKRGRVEPYFLNPGVEIIVCFEKAKLVHPQLIQVVLPQAASMITDARIRQSTERNQMLSGDHLHIEGLDFFWIVDLNTGFLNLFSVR